MAATRGKNVRQGDTVSAISSDSTCATTILALPSETNSARKNYLCQHKNKTVMKKYGILATLMLLSFSASAQIGTIEKVWKVGNNLVSAFKLSDNDVAEMSRRAVAHMDSTNTIDTADYARRLSRITDSLTVDGMNLNFKVYQTTELNAFACGDGSVRVYSGLMDVMDDAELTAIIGHEIGHVARNDAREALRNAYLQSAAKDALGSVGKISGATAKLTETQLTALVGALATAQYSQKQEYDADEFGFQFSVGHHVDPYAMYRALTKLDELAQSGTKVTSPILKAFSSHPDSQKRAARVKAMADALQH